MRISDWSSDVCSSDLGFNDRCDGPFTSLHKRHELGENESRASFRVPRIPPFSPPPELNPHTPKGNRAVRPAFTRSEEHTSELQSLMRISYAVFCLKKKTNTQNNHSETVTNHIQQNTTTHDETTMNTPAEQVKVLKHICND